MPTRKDGEKNYRNIKFTYSVYGENNVFGGSATIFLNYGLLLETPQIVLTVNCKKIDSLLPQLARLCQVKALTPAKLFEVHKIVIKNLRSEL